MDRATTASLLRFDTTAVLDVIRGVLCFGSHPVAGGDCSASRNPVMYRLLRRFTMTPGDFDVLVSRRGVHDA